MFESLTFIGRVRHRRFTSKQHEFAYPLFMFCFDIGDVVNEFKDIKQISVERWNWFSFRRKNYLGSPEISLDNYARELVFNKFKCYPTGKIYLLTQLACFGYCFNPISLYFIFDQSNQQVEYLILEVTNTPWGEKHCYVLASTDTPKKGVYRFEFQKALHVSPFLAMNYTYQCHVKVNKQKIIVHMGNYSDGKKTFDVTLRLTASTAHAMPAQKVFRHYPLVTYKVVAAIYWQALKLWIKGVPFYAHPKKDKEDIVQ